MNSVHIGKAISALREQHDLPQLDLALRIGMQRNELAKIERGHFVLRVEDIEAIAAQFDMTGWELWRFADRLRVVMTTRKEDEPALDPRLWSAA